MEEHHTASEEGQLLTQQSYPAAAAVAAAARHTLENPMTIPGTQNIIDFASHRIASHHTVSHERLPSSAHVHVIRHHICTNYAPAMYTIRLFHVILCSIFSLLIR